MSIADGLIVAGLLAFVFVFDVLEKAHRVAVKVWRYVIGWYE